VYSTIIRGTGKNRVKMNWWQYWIGHCWMTGWQTIGLNFRMWSDLMRGNYDGYALLPEDDPYEECYDWFWTSVNLDETYPKEFLEDLMQISERVRTGEEKTYSIDEIKDMFHDLHTEED
jgi:hypothetical protein